MEPRRFWIHPTLGLTLSFALSVANLVSGGDGIGEERGPGRPAAQSGSVPFLTESQQGFAVHAQHGTDKRHQGKKGTVSEELTSEPGTSPHSSGAPSKPASRHADHAEKHPDYDRMNAENKKALDKESY